MTPGQRRRVLRDSAVALAIATVGLVLTITPGGTWWLLGLAALAGAQTALLRRRASGLPLAYDLYRALAWTLLAFAGVSLLPETARPLADVIALLVVAATIFWPKIRRAR
jgi:multidrug transporter EmrE-like cation transporter